MVTGVIRLNVTTIRGANECKFLIIMNERNNNEKAPHLQPVDDIVRTLSTTISDRLTNSSNPAAKKSMPMLHKMDLSKPYGLFL